MLTAEENEKLTRVGPGTAMGNLLRRYWHPIAATAELMDKPTKKTRILCEDLVLFKDKSDTLGLVEERCAHRRVNLVWGIPEANGLRCPYHGWLYDETGQCIEPARRANRKHIQGSHQANSLPGPGAGRTHFRLPGTRAGSAASQV